MSEALDILFVDDSESDAFLFVRQLTKHNFSINWKRVDNRAALTKALNHEPWDLIIIDYVIPGFSGVEAIRLCYQALPFVPILSTSGVVKEDIIVDTLRAGAYDYVLKGNMQRFVSSVRRALKDAETRQVNVWNQEENKRLNKELALKVEIADVCLSTPGEAMYQDVMNIVLRELNSEFGVFGIIDHQGNLVCPSMTRDIYDRCQVKDKHAVFSPANWVGAWGEALTTGNITIQNEDCVVPKGHIPIKNSLNVPILFQGETIGIIMVANKQGGYSEQDTRSLKTITNHLSPIVKSRLDTARELTQRERAETRFALAIEGANDGVWDWDLVTNEVYYSPRWKEMIGYQDHEIENRYEEWESRIHPEDRVRVKQTIQAHLDGETEVLLLEHRLRHQDESYRLILVRGACKRNHRGLPVLLAGSHSDITQQREAEQERDRLLKEARYKAEETSQLLAGARAVLEEDDFPSTARHLFHACRQAIGAKSGYVALLSEDGEENEVLFLESGGLSCSVDPELPMPIRGLRAEAYQLGKAVYHNDFHHSEWMRFLPEGHVRLDNVVFSPLNIGGKTVGIMGLANKKSDFTEKDLRISEGFGELAAIALKNSRTYEALQQSEEKHRLLADSLERKVNERTKDLQEALHKTEEARDHINTILTSVADGLIVTDNQQRVVLMNPAAESILNVRFDDVVNQSMDQVIHDIPLRERLTESLSQGKTGCEFDFSLEDPIHGASRILRARTAIIPDRRQEQGGVVTIFQDITKDREIDRMKTEFISTAAHELRTPLTSIQGFSEILLLRDNLSTKDRKKYLGYINKQAVGLANIISDLLDISRIESGKGFTLSKQPCDGKKAIESIVPQFQAMTQRHVIQTDLLETPVSLMVDLEKMEQVLKNLLSNSIKYSPEGGDILVQTHMNHEYFTIRILDHGMGMTPEQVEKIFDKFYRADASNTAVEGTGLGMSIVKYIVEAHQGRIDVQSEINKGTSVEIHLPLLGHPVGGAV